MQSKEKTDSKYLQINHDLQWRYLARCSTKDAREQIPLELALKHGVLPLNLFKHGDEKLLTLLCARILTLDSINEIKFISGCRINIEQTNNAFLANAIHAAYSTEDFSQNATIPTLLERILDRAVLMAASDIHIEPFDKKFRVRFRVFGELVEDPLLRLEKEAAKSLIRCIKVKSKIENIWGPCDGKFFTSGPMGLREIRVSILPLAEDEKIVLRFFGNELLNAAKQDYFSLLGLSSFQKEILKTAINLDHGAIIVAGPTGSGKSTILYSCLLGLDLEKLNIVTIEDPVEHRIVGAAQVDLSLCRSIEYGDVLPYVLRQDPDILMLGEIRDAQTANLAFEAALTGRLMMSTLHAANAIEAILRLRKLNVCPSILTACLRLVISGRLVPTNCNQCAIKEKLPQKFVDYFALSNDEAVKSHGCSYCFNTGYSARIGAYEFLPINSSLELGNLKEYAKIQGYRPYSEQILDYLTQGLISFDSACKSLGISRFLFES